MKKSSVVYAGVYYPSNWDPRIELYSLSPRRVKIGESVQRIFSTEIVVKGKLAATMKNNFPLLFMRSYSFTHGREEYTISVPWGLRPSVKLAKNGKGLFWVTGGFYHEKKGYVSNIIDSKEKIIGTITIDLLHLNRCPFKITLEKSNKDLDVITLLSLTTILWSGRG